MDFGLGYIIFIFVQSIKHNYHILLLWLQLNIELLYINWVLTTFYSYYFVHQRLKLVFECGTFLKIFNNNIQVFLKVATCLVIIVGTLFIQFFIEFQIIIFNRPVIL